MFNESLKANNGNLNFRMSPLEERKIHFDDDEDEFENLIFYIEEVECKMTDMEERAPTEESQNNEEHHSVRGSILDSPNPRGRVSDMSMMSSVNMGK